MYDARMAQAERVMVKVVEMSEATERDILAVRNDGQAGFVLVGPNSIVYSEQLAPGFIIDFNLN